MRLHGHIYIGNISQQNLKNSLKEFETERRKQLQEYERIQKGIQDFLRAQAGWREVLEGITLKLQREGIIKYIVENPVYSNLKPWQESDWIEYKKSRNDGTR